MSNSLTSVSRPATRILLVLTLVAGLFGGVTATGAAPAQATASSGVSATTANRALHFAATRRGSLYKYGAVGPRRFDCSGFTKWSYARAGKRLPRSTTQQYRATIRVTRSVRRGDLVFFMSRGRTYHVGIYAGAGRIWHAPKPGQRVRLARIWSRSVSYRRVR
jgi:cell wall-associated NlpC family hydrolase